ncbi:MAG: hypothetical protein LBD38_01985, partial [Streptococcaceae bacterium]|nr:hypothetical protein [Streptococcaceae bacterium]
MKSLKLKILHGGIVGAVFFFLFTLLTLLIKIEEANTDLNEKVKHLFNLSLIQNTDTELNL